MSAGKKNQEKLAHNKVELTGKVSKGPFGKGSKSAHEAIYLKSDKGDFVLRRKGANPFSDPELDKLVGKTVRATGMIADYLFLADDVELA